VVIHSSSARTPDPREMIMYDYQLKIKGAWSTLAVNLDEADVAKIRESAVALNLIEGKHYRFV
jgi:hypothetical protein